MKTVGKLDLRVLVQPAQGQEIWSSGSFLESFASGVCSASKVRSICLIMSAGTAVRRLREEGKGTSNRSSVHIPDSVKVRFVPLSITSGVLESITVARPASGEGRVVLRSTEICGGLLDETCDAMFLLFVTHTSCKHEMQLGRRRSLTSTQVRFISLDFSEPIPI